VSHEVIRFPGLCEVYVDYGQCVGEGLLGPDGSHTLAGDGVYCYVE